MKEDPWFPQLNLDAPPPHEPQWTWTEPKTAASFAHPSFWTLLKTILDHRKANPHLFTARERDPEQLFLEMIVNFRVRNNLPLNIKKPGTPSMYHCRACPQ